MDLCTRLLDYIEMMADCIEYTNYSPETYAEYCAAVHAHATLFDVKTDWGRTVTATAFFEYYEKVDRKDLPCREPLRIAERKITRLFAGE